MENNEKIITVEIEISEKVLNESPILQNYYDAKSKTLSYEIEEDVPNEVVEVLQKFISSDVVGSNQVTLFNPLISALNELQGLKGIEYEPQLSDELEEDVKKSAQLEHLSWDIDFNEYIFDFNKKALGIIGDSEEKYAELEEKAQAVITKALDKQHKNSYQDYKDAIKIIGSFNTALTKAKGELKGPYADTIKMIDNLYNSLKGESDNTKEVIGGNFKKALDIEQAAKDAKAAKVKAEEIAKIAELSESNKEITEKLNSQQNETKRLQAFNKIKYTNIGEYNSKVATACHNYDKQGLETLLIQIKAQSFDNFKQGVEDFDTVLLKTQVTELEDYFLVQKNYWTSIVEKEISNKEIAIQNIQNQATMAGMQKQMPQFPAGDMPFGAPTEPLIQEQKILNNEHEIFEDFLGKLKAFNALSIELDVNFRNITFSDETYRQIQNILTTQSFPQILDWNQKLVDWVESKFKSYEEFRNNNH